jgi:hypothetical protein
MKEDGIWQELLRRKYMSSKYIGQVQHKPGDSQFWAGLMNVKELFLGFGGFKVNNGENTRFWEDVWIRNNPLKINMHTYIALCVTRMLRLLQYSVQSH